MSDDLVLSARTAVDKVKNDLQARFEEDLNNAVKWFCCWYKKTCEQTDYDEKTGTCIFSFDKDLPNSDYWKKHQAKSRWDSSFSFYKRLFGDEIFSTCIKHNNFQGLGEGRKKMGKSNFNFFVAFLSRIQALMVDTRVYYIENALVVEPEFVPVIVNKCTSKEFTSAYDKAFTAFAKAIVKFVLEETANKKSLQGETPVLELGGTPKDSKLTTLHSITCDDTRRLYEIICDGVKEYGWCIKVFVDDDFGTDNQIYSTRCKQYQIQLIPIIK